MKKLLILAAIVLLALNINAQRVWTWTDSINTATLVAIDTVVQPQNKDQIPGGGLGSFYSSASLDAESLNANDAVGYVGGGVQFLRGSNKYYDFEELDSVTLDRTALDRIIRNGGITDTTYTQVFSWTYPHSFDVPMIRFKKGSVTDGYFRWKWVFFRQ